MIVAHITRDMASSVMPAVADRIRAEVASVGISLPLDHGADVKTWTKAEEALSPVSKAWVETMAEFGYQLRFHTKYLFARPV